MNKAKTISNFPEC